ncbi:hypothetical protein [Tenacibaculum xiamenense]|uniref:hypothetical protein n=1 Tax=Tenacibaculum xiamenense TaxID=1261553 RepID=UPI003895BCF2
MKSIFTFFTLLICLPLFSQTEGQSFCSELENEDYFPLTIEKKKILWLDSYYFEEIIGSKEIKNKKYIEFAQNWKAGNAGSLLLREKNGVIYQYEKCCDTETIRFDSKFEKGKSWKTADKKSNYSIKSFNGKLKTPYCDYKNLLVIKGEFTNVTYFFYYKKGYGYIGATDDKNNLISCVSPEWNKK